MPEHIIEIEGYRVKVLKTISEGGFGIVYLVETESRPAQKMALKKVITQDEERYALALKELNFLKSHCSKPNTYFVNYYASKIAAEGPSQYSFYMLLEFGQNGTLFDLMAMVMQKQQRLNEGEIMKIFKTIVEGLVAMHSIGIIHCDLKIENLLFFNWDTIKLCDFGSIDTYNLDFSAIPKQQFYHYESLFEKQTTLMYRPPEMCDLYLGYKVNTKVDMWMLGCVLFTLMFFKHPFHESSKLAIVNAGFFWPMDSQYSEKLENAVRNLLVPDPDLRPSAAELKALVDNWENLQRVELNKMARSIKAESLSKRGNFAAPKSQKSPKAKQQIPDNIFDDNFVDLQPVAKKGGFNFSGLDRLSKQQPDQTSQQQNKNTSQKLGNFNFMSFEFANNADANKSSDFFDDSQQPRSENKIDGNIKASFNDFDVFNKEEKEYEAVLRSNMSSDKNDISLPFSDYDLFEGDDKDTLETDLINVDNRSNL